MAGPFHIGLYTIIPLIVWVMPARQPFLLRIIMYGIGPVQAKWQVVVRILSMDMRMCVFVDQVYRVVHLIVLALKYL